METQYIKQASRRPARSSSLPQTPLGNSGNKLGHHPPVACLPTVTQVPALEVERSHTAF